MQLSHVTQNRDGLLAAITLLSEKQRLGFRSSNPAPYQGIDERNSTTAIGIRAGLALNADRRSDRARYYNPGTGRFLSEDPIGFRGGFNKYAYAFGSPTNLVDPSGNNAFAPALSGFGDAAEFGELIGAAQFIPGLNAVVDTALTAAAAGAIVYAGYEILSAANTASPDPGRKPEGNCCFAAGTPVHTDHNEVAVEKVGVGDKVLSRNRSTGKLEYQKVIALTHPHLDGLVELHVAGEHDALRPSLDHPFWVKRIPAKHADWMLAAKIRRGDLLQTTDGEWKKVLSTNPIPGQQIVYNFTVDQNHDYFVGKTGFLVHNEDCGCGPKRPKNFIPPTNPPQMPPTEIPEGWEVYSGQPNSIYPNGYWKLLKPMANGGMQRIDPSTMQPGSMPETHVEYPPGMCPPKE